VKRPFWHLPGRRMAAGLAAALLGAAPQPLSAEEPRGGRPPVYPPTVPTGAAPLNPQEQRELGELERDYQRYATQARLHEERMQAILYSDYLDKQKQLETRYSEKIATAEKSERQRQLEAIALLEEFLRKYPDHPQFTPDSMFRLADLYLDQANYEFEHAFDKQEAAAAEGDTATASADMSAEVDAEAEEFQGPDYTRSLALWRDIIGKFPEYRQRAGTLYLLGYYLNETGRDRESRQAFLGLVCKNKHDPLKAPPPPPTREELRRRMAMDKKSFVDPYADCQALTEERDLVDEAWVRGVGDSHFNTPGELNEAIVAYKKVASNAKSRFYEDALYKLAWTYYRNDEFIKGVDAFDTSVKHYDAQVKAGMSPVDLRSEAIEYIAISFTDPWSATEELNPARSLERAVAYYDGRFTEPHVRDVFEQLGDTLRIIEGYAPAVDAYRIAITKYPLHPRNPLVHQKIVSALETLGDKDAADEEAAKLASAYAKGSAWYKANETDREAMETQARIGERMLRSAAENTHRAAQIARKEWEANPTPENEQAYKDLYSKSATLYRRFVTEYPTAEEAPEFTYRLGETLYWSERYLAAVEHYRWAVQHPELLSPERLESAARSVVLSYQKAIEQAVGKGEIKEPPVPSVDDLKAAQQPVKPMQIPKLYGDLQAAYDEYEQTVNDPQRAPNMAYLSALISYRYLHLDDAAKRFSHVMDRYCGKQEAAKAKDGLLAIYDARGENSKFRATNEQFIKSKCGTDQDIALAQAQNRSKEFRAAEELFKGQKYEVAAQAFYGYYKNAPTDDPSLPVSLYNSAIAYDKAGKPKTAVHLFKEFTSNPSPAFRGSEYYLEALYLTAVSHQKAFDYQSAVDVYLNVVTVSSEPGRKQPPGQRTLEQIRLDALYNAAVLRELDRVYKDPKNQPGTGAASLFKRYASLEPDRRKRDRAMWAVARIHEAGQDAPGMLGAYDAWRKEYGSDPGNADDYVFTYYNTARLYTKLGKTKDADQYRRQTIEAWAKVGGPTNSPGADMAAECEFHFAEQHYQTKFDTYKITKVPTSEKKAKEVLDQLDKLTEETKARFVAIGKYKAPLWGLAALVRVGDTMFFSGQKLQQAPVPKQIVDLDAKYPDKEILLQYEESIEGLVKPKLEAAKDQWEKVVAAGKRDGVSNKWTQLALVRLHDFVSQEDYPVLREDLVEGTESP
jgi:tetratricopeptide (TPR) repeat protein